MISTVILEGTNVSPIIGSTGTYTISCTVDISCSTTCSNDMLNITWILNGQPIDSNYFTISNNSPYTITNSGAIASILTTTGTVSIEHAGRYTCIGSLKSGSTANEVDTVILRCKYKFLLTVNIILHCSTISCCYCY